MVRSFSSQLVFKVALTPSPSFVLVLARCRDLFVLSLSLAPSPFLYIVPL